MNSHEAEALAGIVASIESLLDGSVADARAVLGSVGPACSGVIADLSASLARFVDQFAESIAGKESALANLQLSMLELETARDRLREEVADRIGMHLQLQAATAHLRVALETTEKIIESAPFALVVVGANQLIRRANGSAGRILRSNPELLVGQSWSRFINCPPGGILPASARETEAVDAEGNVVTILLSEIPATLVSEEVLIEAFVDLTERKRLETLLRHSQKLESVGQLAAGIAHEINTPAQYVNDSLQFLAQAFQDQRELFLKYRRAINGELDTVSRAELLKELMDAEERVDMEYIMEHAPGAFGRAAEGISRITAIVRALKEFAHPDRREKKPADLNRALQATLVITRNEYKYVADVETEFGELPLVLCHIGDINQVFLNLLVNAAQAIAAQVGESGRTGRIRVRTRCDGEMVRIDVEDTGCGIPSEIRGRVFDPFFTTKEVGRGTGQGLAIARSIVVDKHEGSLTFATEVGKGTTFTILLPVDPGSRALGGCA